MVLTAAPRHTTGAHDELQRAERPRERPDARFLRQDLRPGPRRWHHRRARAHAQLELRVERDKNGAVFLAWAHLPVGTVEVMIAIEYKAFDHTASCLRPDHVVRVDNREVFMPYKAAA